MLTMQFAAMMRATRIILLAALEEELAMLELLAVDCTAATVDITATMETLAMLIPTMPEPSSLESSCHSDLLSALSFSLSFAAEGEEELDLELSRW